MVALGVDRISWASSPNGEFDLKEAYNLAYETYDTLQGESFKGNWVWRTSTIPKIRCFLWQCLHKSIPAREVLNVRGLNTPLSCPICCNEVESIIHILRDCSQSRAFWDSFPLLFFPTYSMVQICWIGYKLTVPFIKDPSITFLGAPFFCLVYNAYGLGEIE